MKKRAQITVFIILGIIIFAIIGLLFFMRGYVKSQEFAKEETQVQELFTAQGKYFGYMQSCLEQASKQAVALVGMQGGVIYEQQAPRTKAYLGPPRYEYGKYVLPFQTSDDFDLFPDTKEAIFDVNYGIHAPDIAAGIPGHPNVPDYPHGPVKLLADPSQVDPTFKNLFGNMFTNPFPPLCDYYGANSPELKGAIFSCETYDSKRETEHDNVQEYLEQYIGTAFEECVALESLPEFSESSMQTGNITVDVTFAPTSIAIKAEYPIVAGTQNDEATVSLQTFHTTLNVRLQQMHEIATRIIEEDINNIFFNAVRDANELATCKEAGKEDVRVTCLKEGMKIIKFREVCQTTGQCKGSSLFDDIIMIQDQYSLINGKPLALVFAIQNRYPALERIHQDHQEDPIYNIVVNIGEEITITPQAFDPDEDSHGPRDDMQDRFIYSGWKFDYDEEYDEDTAAPRRLSYGAATRTFTISNNQATYTTDARDKGPHIVQVQVCDNAGQCDFQNVKILVKQP